MRRAQRKAWISNNKNNRQDAKVVKKDYFSTVKKLGVLGVLAVQNRIHFVRGFLVLVAAFAVHVAVGELLVGGGADVRDLHVEAQGLGGGGGGGGGGRATCPPPPPGP